MTLPSSDRRKDIRILEHLPVSVEWIDNGAKTSASGLCLSLSEGGASLRSDCLFPASAKLLISLQLPTTPSPLQMFAHIVRSDKKNKVYNVEFSNRSIFSSRIIGTYVNQLLSRIDTATDRRVNNDRRNTGNIDISEKAERRTSNDRRKLTLQQQLIENGEFLLEKTVYLTDTNAFGNTYFAQYFDWQGMAREAFVRSLIPNYEQFFASGIKLITTEAHMQYKNESRVFDDLHIIIRLGEVRRTTAELLFEFVNKRNKKILGVGSQKIAFANHNGKIIAIPGILINGIKPYLKSHIRQKSGSLLPSYHYADQRNIKFYLI
jgi:acyl-CoA thioesterase FadM